MLFQDIVHIIYNMSTSMTTVCSGRSALGRCPYRSVTKEVNWMYVMRCWGYLISCLSSACLAVLATLVCQHYQINHIPTPTEYPDLKTHDGESNQHPLQESIPHNPDIDVAQALNLGRVLLGRGENEEAALAFRVAAKASDGSSKGHVAAAEAKHGLGLALRASGKAGEALEACREAENLNPEFSTASVCVGSLLAEAGDWENALAALRRAAELEPNAAEPNGSLGAALVATGQTDEAIPILKRAMAADPRDSHAAYNLGVAWQSKGDTGNAIDAFTRCLELSPTLTSARVNLGAQLLKAGRVRDAELMLLTAIRLAEDAESLAAAHANLGAVLERGGRKEEALEAYSEAVRWGAGRTWLLRMAELYREMGQREEALRASQRALEEDGEITDASPLRQAGLLLEEMGRLEEAVDHFAKATELDGDDLEATVHLGNCQHRLGLFHDALESFARAVRLDPENPATYKLLRAALSGAEDVEGVGQGVIEGRSPVGEGLGDSAPKAGIPTEELGGGRDSASRRNATDVLSVGVPGEAVALSRAVDDAAEDSVGEDEEGADDVQDELDGSDTAAESVRAALLMSEGLSVGGRAELIFDGGSTSASDSSMGDPWTPKDSPVKSSFRDGNGDGVVEQTARPFVETVAVVKGDGVESEDAVNATGAEDPGEHLSGNTLGVAGPVSDNHLDGVDEGGHVEDGRGRFGGGNVAHDPDPAEVTANGTRVSQVDPIIAEDASLTEREIRPSLTGADTSTGVFDPNVDSAAFIVTEDASFSTTQSIVGTKGSDMGIENVADEDVPFRGGHTMGEVGPGVDFVPCQDGNSCEVSGRSGLAHFTQERDNESLLGGNRKAGVSGGVGLTNKTVVSSKPEAESPSTAASTATEEQSSSRDLSNSTAADSSEVLTPGNASNLAGSVGLSSQIDSQGIEGAGNLSPGRSESSIPPNSMRESGDGEGVLAGSSTVSYAMSSSDQASGLVTEAAELTSEGEIEDLVGGTMLGVESAMSPKTASISISIEERQDSQKGDAGAAVVGVSPSQSSAVPPQASESVVEPSDGDLDAVGRVNQSYFEAAGGIGPGGASISSEVEPKESTGPKGGTTNIMNGEEASPRVGSPEVEGKVGSSPAEEPAESGVSGSSSSTVIAGSSGGPSVPGDPAPPVVSEEDMRRAQSKVKLGLARLHKGQYSIAASIFDKAASLDPNWWAGYYYGAEARQSMGDAEGAAKAMISALRLSSASKDDEEVPQMSVLASKIIASLEVDSKVADKMTLIADLKAAVEAAGLILSEATPTKVAEETAPRGSLNLESESPIGRDKKIGGHTAEGLRRQQPTGEGEVGRIASMDATRRMDGVSALEADLSQREKLPSAAGDEEVHPQADVGRRRWPFGGRISRSDSEPGRSGEQAGGKVPAESGSILETPRQTAHKTSEGSGSGSLPASGAAYRDFSPGDEVKFGGKPSTSAQASAVKPQDHGASRFAEGGEGNLDEAKGTRKAGWGGGGWVGRKQGNRSPERSQGSASLEETALSSIDSGISAEEFIASMGLSPGTAVGSGEEETAKSGGIRQNSSVRSGNSGTGEKGSSGSGDGRGIRGAIGRLFGRRDEQR